MDISPIGYAVIAVLATGAAIGLVRQQLRLWGFRRAATARLMTLRENPGATVAALPGDGNPNLYIIDDDTLDTVVACAACDWEERYNPDPGDADTYGHLDEDWRVNEALSMAGDDHDCGIPDGPLRPWRERRTHDAQR